MEKTVEGLARITVREGVFFNPKMRKLRDLSVLFLKAFAGKNASVLDATAATGVRGIRYALESGLKDVTLLDMNKAAYKNTVANLRQNRIKGSVLNESVQAFANTTDERFDVIDLDPFGSPAPNVYDVMKVVKDGTLLMVTATDTAVLCGAHPGACIKLYNAKPLHGELCQETGLRILIGFLLRNAMQFNYGIEPLVSIADMHYMRAFLRVKHGADAALESSKELGFGSFCAKCKNVSAAKGIAPLVTGECANCGNAMEPFGPLWLGRLNDKTVIGKMLTKHGKAYSNESRELLEELDAELDTFMFYSVPKLTKYLGMGSVSPAAVMKALVNRGHSASATHFSRDAIKTDAGIKDVLAAVKKASA